MVHKHCDGITKNLQLKLREYNNGKLIFYQLYRLRYSPIFSVVLPTCTRKQGFLANNIDLKFFKFLKA